MQNEKNRSQDRVSDPVTPPQLGFSSLSLCQFVICVHHAVSCCMNSNCLNSLQSSVVHGMALAYTRLVCFYLSVKSVGESSVPELPFLYTI